MVNKRKNNHAPDESDIVRRVKDGLIKDYGYSSDEIGLEALLPGKLRRYADLIVYESAKRTAPLIIFEIKRDIRYPIMADEVISYLKESGAKYAVLTDGKERICYALVNSEVLEVSDIPRKDERIEELSKGQLKPAKNLEYKFWKIIDRLRSGPLPQTAYLDEVNKLILCKLVDERSSGPLRFVVTPEEIAKVQDLGTQEAILQRINSIFEEVKKQYPDLFSKNEQIRLDPLTLVQALSELQLYSFTQASPDILGTFYEDFVSRSMRAASGQYFTPRHVVDFIVKLLDPNEQNTVLDPACGSGGFILKTMLYVLDKTGKAKTDYAKKMLFSIDINQNMVSTARMNLLLHGDGHSNVFLGDSLQLVPDEVKRVLDKGGFDLIMCNPPMGRLVHKGEYRDDYALFKNKPTVRVEYLFLERCLYFLKPGGIMAVIVPEGILFSESSLKPYLLKNALLRAVISLPRATFLSYGMGIKTSILILQKLIPTHIPADYEIFMAEIKDVGYDSRERPSWSDELNKVLNAYHDFVKGEEIEESTEPRIFTKRSPELSGDWTVHRNDPSFEQKEMYEKVRRNLLRLGGSVSNLEDISTLTRGFYVSSQNYVIGGAKDSLPYIRIGDMQGETVSKLNLKHVRVPEKRIRHDALANPGDILLSTDGTIGRVAIVPDSMEGLASSGMIIVRPDSETIDREYLYTVLASDIIKKQLERFKTGTIIQHVSIKDIRRLKIPVPPLAEQKRIINEIRALKSRTSQLDSEKTVIQEQISRILGGTD
jgi:type I restriction enzyme M protein